MNLILSFREQMSETRFASICSGPARKESTKPGCDCNKVGGEAPTQVCRSQIPTAPKKRCKKGRGRKRGKLPTQTRRGFLGWRVRSTADSAASSTAHPPQRTSRLLQGEVCKTARRTTIAIGEGGVMCSPGRAGSSGAEIGKDSRHTRPFLRGSCSSRRRRQANARTVSGVGQRSGCGGRGRPLQTGRGAAAPGSQRTCSAELACFASVSIGGFFAI